MIGLPPRDPSLQDERFEAFQLAIARRYRIERELGHGGMATVYLTGDLKHGRPVALKLLRPEVAAMLGSERFLREIQVSARLSHPNILPLYDSDEAAGLLFYVMPYIEGGTLHDRLERGPRPDVAEALDLTRQVAAGLAYAHEEGVIHRDIKPANILLASGHAFISDFGIARMVRQAVTTEGMTEAGFAVGTPDYMAPEQSRGTSQVDGRADEYSLAAVLFEMLVGHPPSHTGGTAAKVRRGLRAARPDLPPVIESALIRALANESDARFKTVAEFAAALEGAMVPVEVRRGPSRLRSMVLAAGAIAVLVGAWQAVKHFRERAAVAVVAADTTRYVIFPFEDPNGVGATLDESDRLHDALMRWSGLSVVDPRDVAEQLAKLRSGHPTSAEAAEIARRLNGGRYIRGEVSRLSDSLRIHATIYDVQAGQLKDYTVRIPPDLSGAESRFATLTDQLLFRGPGAGAVTLTGSRSLPALQAFGRGQTAILDWNLAAADSAFGESVGFDAQFAQGQLWLALTRMWKNDPAARWYYLAQQAGAAHSTLPAREQSIASALLTQGRGDLGAACSAWRSLADRLRTDFVSWYGTAVCLARDTLVLPDSRSPSGHSFRASRHAALQAYRKAFELRPAVLATFRASSFESARGMFYTHRGLLRAGRAPPPDTTRFLAYPSWGGDTLGFIPYPIARIEQSDPAARSNTTDLAVRHQREEFHEIALTWATAIPTSPAALEALAVSLELLGDRAALDMIARARAVARNMPLEANRLAATEVWMRVQLALPDDTTSLRRAVEIADSFLTPETVTTSPEAEPLLGLAMLTGRATLAAQLSRRTAREVDWGLPDPIINDAPALLTFSSLGGPEDSLIRLESVVGRGIDRLEPASARLAANVEWLGRAAAIAFPAYQSRSLPHLQGLGYPRILGAEMAFARGDTVPAKRILESIARGRIGIASSDLSLDALYPETWLLAAMGDRRLAVERLDPTLNHLAATGPSVFTDPPGAGALVRAMALRARLAEQEGDLAQARRWAVPVTMLWKEADAFLQPVVESMHRIEAFPR